MGEIRVMIVDDDILAVDYLVNLIDWEKYGFKIVATANNGKQALKQLKMHTPQLIITDISMPLLDGIELTIEVKKAAPETRIILLTAYSEFEYARKALQQGVDFYLIKSEITEFLLIERLGKVRDTLQGLDKISYMLFQKALIDCISVGEEYVEANYLDANVTRMLKQPYIYMVLEQDTAISLDKKVDRGEAIHFARIIKTGNALNFEMQLVQTAMISDNRSVLLWKNATKGRGYNNYQAIVQTAVKIKQALTIEYGIPTTVFYTPHEVRLKEIMDFLRKDILTKQKIFFEGSNQIYNLFECRMEYNQELIECDERIVRECFQTGSIKDFRAYINQIKGKKNADSLHMNRVILNLELVYRYLRKSAENLLDIEDGKNKLIKSCYYDRETICADLIRYFEFLVALREKQQRKKFAPEVLGAITYIKKYYSNKDLKIADIAEKVGISCSHLSVLFKENTDKTVLQYITQIRIEYAKQLLDKGDLKVYEVAELVGYGNSQYLSQVFFKETGMYPADYRRRTR